MLHFARGEPRPWLWLLVETIMTWRHYEVCRRDCAWSATLAITTAIKIAVNMRREARPAEASETITGCVALAGHGVNSCRAGVTTGG